MHCLNLVISPEVQDGGRRRDSNQSVPRPVMTGGCASTRCPALTGRGSCSGVTRVSLDSALTDLQIPSGSSDL